MIRESLRPIVTFERAVLHLQEGGVVAAATETFFALLADALKPQALDRLWSIKPRSSGKAFGLIAGSSDDCLRVVEPLSPGATAVANAFWPGPLTLALKAKPELDARLCLNGTVAVRVPPPCPARALAMRAGLVLTATSANPPGVSPATSARQMRALFPDAVRDEILLVLPGHAPGGLPSTILSFADEQPRIVREGAVATRAILERVPMLGLVP